MEQETRTAPSVRADQYVIRFFEDGQRQRLKEQAKREKRSLNSHLLVLLEAGEKAMSQLGQGAQA